MRKPINQLRLAYYRYLYVRACYRARQGYLAVWINDVEIEKARNAVTRIEKTMLTQDPTIEAAGKWSEMAGKLPRLVYEHDCKQNYNDLILSAPSSPEVKDFGQSLPGVKDFEQFPGGDHADEMKAIMAFGTVLSIVYIRDCNGKTTDRAAKAAWSNYLDPELKPYIDIIEPGFTANRAKQGDVAYCIEVRRSYLDLVREIIK